MKISYGMKCAQVALCIPLISVLAACGNSAPSESDAKHAVEAQLGECKYVDLSDFSKVNGIQGNDDHHYQVEVQYDLTLEADSDQKDKLQTWVKNMTDRQNLIKEEMQIRQSYVGRGVSMSDADAQTIQDDEQKQAALYQALVTGYGPRTFGTAFDQACPSFPSDITHDLFTKVDGPGFDGKNTLQFHYKLDMVKTDNGWQLDR